MHEDPAFKITGPFTPRSGAYQDAELAVQRITHPWELQRLMLVIAGHLQAFADRGEYLGNVSLKEDILIADIRFVGDGLIPGRDYEPSVCDNCGNDKHTPEELRACFDSMVAVNGVAAE